MLIPPCYQSLVIGSFVSDFPIDLWGTIVNPSILYPKKDVCIQIIIILQSIRIAAIGRVTLFVSIYSKRRYAKLHPRLCTLDSFTQLLNEDIDIISSPVVTILDTITIHGKFFIVRDNLTSCRIWIKIVVYMQSINIIALDNISHYLTDIIFVLRNTGIKDILTVISKDTLRMFYGKMSISQSIGVLRLGAIGIYPGMYFHATSVTLSDHPFQWIPIRIWSNALGSC